MIAAPQNQPQVSLDFDPSHQRPVKLVTPELSAEVIAKADDPITGVSRSIMLKTGSSKALIPLPFQFEQVNAIVQGPPGRLLIVGMSGGDMYEVGILDTAADKVIDRIECYNPAVSPEGRYVAFTKFYGPHSTPLPDDHDMIYNVVRSPAENRPRGITTDDKDNVGFALYPWGIGNSYGDNGNVPPESAHVSGWYFWNGSQYFFGDRTAGKLHVIWVAIASGTATVRSAAVTQSQLGPERKDFFPWLEGAELAGDKIHLTVRIASRSLAVAVALSDFVSLGSVDLNGQPAGAP